MAPSLRRASRRQKPALLITIDTEGDNVWASPRVVTTRNARHLPRFQTLCEKYGFQPTWLTNYEMAVCPVFREFGQDVLRRSAGEIGMHLHAWNSPPLVALTDDDLAYHPYLTEYPESVARDKIRFLTDLLEDRFGRKMVSHRAGRWAFDARYARMLVECGYRVDCSVTPHCDWSNDPGDPDGSGGTDYTAFPVEPYFLDPRRIDRPGDLPLLEVPVTIVRTRYAVLGRLVRHAPSLIRRGVCRVLPPIAWLRPNGRNRGLMLRILEEARQQRWPCVEFMLHSSELMPGGSPRFRTPARVERLYADVEAVLGTAAGAFAGATVGQFAARYMSCHSPVITT